MAAINEIEYITIASLGNGTDFGDMLSAKEIGGSHVSSGSRGVIGAGYPADNVLQYITCASLGDAIDFGDLITGDTNPSAVSNGTRGIWFGGAYNTAMDYITIATTGDASDFGDYMSTISGGGTCMSDTRGVYMGGNDGTPGPTGYVDAMGYLTMASLGNATDFGDLSEQCGSMPGCCSNGVRGIRGKGYNSSTTEQTTIEYITIASLGNVTAFGDMAQKCSGSGACSDGTKGLWGGGSDPTRYDLIEYITITSLGNSTDFGNLVGTKSTTGCLSGDSS